MLKRTVVTVFKRWNRSSVYQACIMTSIFPLDTVWYRFCDTMWYTRIRTYHLPLLIQSDTVQFWSDTRISVISERIRTRLPYHNPASVSGAPYQEIRIQILIRGPDTVSDTVSDTCVIHMWYTAWIHEWYICDTVVIHGWYSCAIDVWYMCDTCVIHMIRLWYTCVRLL